MGKKKKSKVKVKPKRNPAAFSLPGSSGALASIDMRQFKFAPKPYEGGAPGLRSQNKK